MTRDQCRQKGYLSRIALHFCPRCESDCEVMFTPVKDKPVGIHCTECDWEQYPKTKRWSEETRAQAQELREIMEEFKSKKISEVGR